MRSRSGKTFVTFLMFIPLISIPLMAVFGIPEFSGVNRDDPLGFSAESKSLTKSNLGQPFQLTGEIPEDNRSQPFESAKTATAHNLQGVNPFEIAAQKTDHKGLKGWAVERQQQSSTANVHFKRSEFYQERSRTRDDNRQSLDDLDSIIDKKTNHASEKSSNAAAAFSVSDHGKWDRISNATDHTSLWRAAIGKLQKIGIEDYTLKPGSSPKLFHFSCTIPGNSNLRPRILHRFEAESEDPLHAIGDVIEQVEEWLQQNS